MGMSIDESIEVIKHEKPEKPTSMYGIMKKNAFNTAIETMHKYQKIEQLIADYEEYKWERIDVKDIREIIDGNNSR